MVLITIMTTCLQGRLLLKRACINFSAAAAVGEEAEDEDDDAMTSRSSGRRNEDGARDRLAVHNIILNGMMEKSEEKAGNLERDFKKVQAHDMIWKRRDANEHQNAKSIYGNRSDGIEKIGTFRHSKSRTRVN
jgi:hypothetical protein